MKLAIFTFLIGLFCAIMALVIAEFFSPFYGFLFLPGTLFMIVSPYAIHIEKTQEWDKKLNGKQSHIWFN